MEGKAEGCPVRGSGPAPALARMLLGDEGTSMNFQLQPTKFNKGKHRMTLKTSPPSFFFCPLRRRLLGVAETSSPTESAAALHWATRFGKP